MTQPQLLMAMLLAQQSLFASLWLVSAHLRMARRPSWHWVAATAMVAAGMGLILVRDQVSLWWSMAAANLLIVAGIASLRRGMQLFVRATLTDREQGAVVALEAVALLVIIGNEGTPRPVAVVGSILAAWTLLRMAWEMRKGLAAELGERAARWCVLPALLIGLLFGARALLLLLIAPDQPGSMAVQSTQNVVTAFVMMLFGLVINTMLVVMTIMRLVHRLRYQSEHDVLTELLNRRAMERLVAAEARRQQRMGGTHALLALDIDHFKRVNDQYGHGAGDEVLRQVARVLRSSCRDTDHVGRMGGEEFGILLPGTDEAGAGVLAERLLKGVRALDLQAVAPGLRVTVSIGLVVVKDSAEPLDALLARLDQALYAAKHAGRDRLVRAAPVPHGGQALATA